LELLCFTKYNSTFQISSQTLLALWAQLKINSLKKHKVRVNFTYFMKQPKEYFTNSSFQLPREVRVKLIAFAIGYTEKRFASFFSPIEAGRSPVSLSRSPWSLNRCHRPRLLVGEMDRFGDALPILQKFGFDSSSPAAGSSRHGQLFSDWLFSGRFGLIAATTPFVIRLYVGGNHRLDHRLHLVLVLSLLLLVVQWLRRRVGWVTLAHAVQFDKHYRVQRHHGLELNTHGQKEKQKSGIRDSSCTRTRT
jgi:hypothetical protein